MAPRERVRRMMMGGNEETKQTFDSISSIVDAEVQRVATISTSGPAQRKRTANALNSGTVPTELLSADGARALELPKGGEPGCGLRLLARRPRLVLVTVYVTFGLLLALLFTVGELEISVDSDAFVNKEDVDVQRVRLAHELFLNSAWNQGPSYGWRAESATENLFNWNYRGRRLREQEGDREQTDEEGGDDEQVHLDASAPTQHGRLLQSSCRSNEGKPTTSFTLIYSARTGSNVLEPQLLQRIAYIELSLARLAERKGLCKYPLSLGSPPPGSSRPALFESCDSCTPIDSALGYIFPSGIPSVRGRHRAKYLRSQIPMTLAEWRDAMNDGRALEFMNLLEELRKNPDVNVYTDIVDRYWTLPERQLRADLVGDGILLGVANLLILIFMVFYFRNVLFAFAAVMQLVLALPLTFLIVDVVFKQRPISAFACASIWVVTGVTADNIFVVHETWKAARLLRVNGELASRERRLRWTLAQSARPLFVADGTTAFSLLINCLSPIGGVFQFGLVGGVLIFANFLLVLVYTSALLMMEEQGAFNWCNCWRMGEKEEKAHLLLLHRIHAAIFTYRRPILVAGIVLTLLLVPSAGALTAPSEGSSFDIFVGFTPPADALFINANTFNPNLPGDVYLSQTDAASSAARGEPSAPAHWRNLLLGGKMREPNVALTLWPSTAGWGVLVLVADAVLLLLAARVCWRGRTIGALRLPSYFQRMSKPARRQWVWLAGLLAAALLGIAAFVIVMGTMNPMAAAALWGCEYATAAFFFYARWAPALSANLFYSRALPIAYEAIFAMHAMACAAMAASLSKDKGCPECLFGVRAGLGRPRRDEKQRLLLAYGLMAVFGIAACLPPFIRRASIQAEDDLEGLAAVLMTLCLVLLALLDDGYMRQVSPERAGYPAADTTSRPPMNISQTRPAQGMFIGSTVEGCTAWVRRAFGLLVSGLGAGAAICYAQLFLLSSVVVSSVPAQLAGATLLVHALPLACIADAWALGVPFAGFEPSDAPRGVWLKRVVRLLLLLAVGSVVVGSALVYIGMMSSEDASAASGDEGLRQALVGLDEASLTTAEPCFMVWGVRSRLLDKASPAPNRVMLPESDNGAAADLIADFDPTSTAAQLAFDAMCTAILQPSSPLNSRAKESSSVWPWCTAHSVRRSVQQAGGAWPMAPQAFTTKLVSMLQSGPEARLGSTVGLRGQVTNNASAVLPEQLAWILVRLNSKYSTANGEMLGSPRRLEAYMREWKDYFEDLPRLTGSTVAGVARTDILSNGFVTCSSWEVFPTISAFLRGVFLSLILTPCMCLCAVFMIVRDVNICYASLLSVVCMIVVTMGVLHLMGTALGPIESLALAVIIGVSVDYLIHLAFAYNNSFMQSRYFKSRASVLARSDSIFSAAITTFAAVLPLLGARIAPLRQFGRIFTVVTVISFVYSYGFFNAFLMSMGALSTRSTTIAQDEADIQSAHADRADDVGFSAGLTYETATGGCTSFSAGLTYETATGGCTSFSAGI
ncbi:patched domain-containing protein 2 [Chrysochromulina tobinii]|uniref:Patched domain-containing protein 2 n=1 Tax=Chrysochromulina tobinii TaxID=1460289 RepID=A0A0M0JV13_9EUKA|nr:patched domain-containing protein 2 [Chrysochromulina tobinii]|eukprot:KOO30192.1 patched domain-containing protein 2 [Chrysochromulina sp. CCMP291]